jgi:hypothetical protein
VAVKNDGGWWRMREVIAIESRLMVFASYADWSRGRIPNSGQPLNRRATTGTGAPRLGNAPVKNAAARKPPAPRIEKGAAQSCAPPPKSFPALRLSFFVFRSSFSKHPGDGENEKEER